MIVNRGGSTHTTAGGRVEIYCEGDENSIDINFYKTVLGQKANQFEFKPVGSSNNLLCFAETTLIRNGFCLIDRDYRTDEEVEKLEGKYKIKFLKVHEVEYFILNEKYLKQLPNIKKDIDINQKIEEVIDSLKLNFLADFLQFRINSYLEQFPRIKKLENSEIIDFQQVQDLLFEKLDRNYTEVQNRISLIKNEKITAWLEEFEKLTFKQFPSKEIFDGLKSKIFNNAKKTSDIAKEIALLMEEDNYIPEELETIFFPAT